MGASKSLLKSTGHNLRVRKLLSFEFRAINLQVEKDFKKYYRHDLRCRLQKFVSALPDNE